MLYLLFYGTIAGEIPDDNMLILNVVHITNPFVPDMSKLEPFDGKKIIRCGLIRLIFSWGKLG